MEDITALRSAVGMNPYGGPAAFGTVSDEVRKALTPASGVVGYNLERKAKLMMPLFTFIRRRLPTDSPQQGALKASWRTFFAHGESFNKFGVAFGAIGAEQSNTATTIEAPYSSHSFSDTVYIESIDMARNFDDAMQVSVNRLLAATMKQAELMNIFANYTALAAPTVTATAVATGGSLVTAGTATVSVTALTYEGYLTPSQGGSAAYGESTAVAVSAGAIATTTGSVNVTWAAVPGAVAYNVYYTNATATYFIAQTTTNKYTITTAVTTAAVNSSDSTANTNTYEGMLAWCQKSTMYGVSIPNKTFVDQAGAALSSAADGIPEFDTVLKNIWVNWNMSPTMIITSPQGVRKATSLLL
ncbi:MAG TPA: hypothetical protein VGA61_02245, partial [Anaerolineae bacterium]